MRKRFLALVLAAAMVIPALPSTAVASEAGCPGEDGCAHEAAIGTTHYDTLQAAVDAAGSGVTVTMLRDVSYENGDGNGTGANLQISQNTDVTLDMAGHSITGYAGWYVIDNYGGLTIQNGHINMGESTEENIEGDDSGCYGIRLKESSTKLTIIDSSITMENSGYAWLIWVDADNANRKITIDGGTFNGWIYNGDWDTGAPYTNDAVVISGTFDSDPTDKNKGSLGVKLADGSIWDEATNTVYNTSGMEPVATVGSENYLFISQAITAWRTNGGTLTLLDDAAYTGSINLDSSSATAYTLDLNGHEFEWNGKIHVSKYKNSNSFTIKDSIGNGVLRMTNDQTDKSYGHRIRISGSGSFTLESGTIEETLEYRAKGSVHSVVGFNDGAEKATIQIQGGTIVTSVPTNEDGKRLTAVPASVEGGNSVSISGGTFVVAEEPPADYLATDYAWIATADGWQAANTNGMVARVENGGLYASLQEAITAAGADDTVILLGDVTEETPVEVAADDALTLDLNGHTVASLTNSGDLTLTDSTQSGNTAAGAVTALTNNSGILTMESGGVGTLTITGGTVSISGGRVTGELPESVTSGTLSISGGWFANDPSAYVAAGYGASGNGTNGYTVAEGVGDAAKKWYGEGTNLIIDSVEDMLYFASLVNSGDTTKYDFTGKTVRLDDDLDFTGKTYIPVGTAAHPFTGTFDGAKSADTAAGVSALSAAPRTGEEDSHTITGISVTGQYAGVFGYLSENAKVQNLTVTNSTFTTVDSGTAYAGAIAAMGAGTISNCTVTNCQVREGDATSHLGGLVGGTSSGVTIQNCAVTGGAVTGDSAGQVIGQITGGETKLENITMSGMEDADLVSLVGPSTKITISGVTGEGSEPAVMNALFGAVRANAVVALNSGSYQVKEATSIGFGTSFTMGSEVTITQTGTDDAVFTLDHDVSFTQNGVTVTMPSEVEKGDYVDQFGNLHLESTGVTITKNGEGGTTQETTTDRPAVADPNGVVVYGLGGAQPTVDSETGAIIIPAGGSAVQLGEKEKNYLYGGSVANGTITDNTPTGTVHSITIQTTGSGTVTANVSDNKAAAGAGITLTVTPSTNYQLIDLAVTQGQKSVTLTKHSDSQYSFIMPDGDVTVTAEFAEAGTVLTKTLDLRNKNPNETGTGWKWDNATKTLTLSGIDVRIPDSEGTDDLVGIHLPDGSTIVLAANTKNEINVGSAENAVYGISCDGKLTIQGTGTLTVQSGDSETKQSYGIAARGLDIEGGSLEVTTGDTGGNADSTGPGVSAGIVSFDGDIVISGGSVTAHGGDTTGSGATSGGILVYGIEDINSDKGDIRISGSGTVVEAYGGDSTGTAVTSSNGIGVIRATGDIKVSGGAQVTAQAGDANRTYGIHGKNVSITGSLVEAVGGGVILPVSPDDEQPTREYAYSSGIYAYTGLTVGEGGRVRARGGENTAAGSSYGIYIENGVMDVNDGPVEAAGHTQGAYWQHTADLNGYVNHIVFVDEEYNGEDKWYVADDQITNRNNLSQYEYVLITEGSGDFTLNIVPADIIIYMGGEDGYEGTHHPDSGIDQGNTSMPSPVFYVSLSGTAQWYDDFDGTQLNTKDFTRTLTPDEAEKIIITGNGDRRWKLEHAGKDADSNDLYYIDATGTGQDPVRVQFIDEDGEVQISDSFVPDENKLNTTYQIKVYQGGAADVAASIPGILGQCKVDTEKSGTLTVHYVVDNRSDNPVSLVQDAVSRPVDSGSAAVTAPTGTSYTLNDTTVPVDETGVGLLFDEIYREDGLGRALVQRVSQALSDSDFQYDARYLDLVDEQNGNAWVKADKAVTIYWGYPEGTDEDTEFVLLHFDGLHRGMDEITAEDVASWTNVERVTIDKTEYGVQFTAEPGSFSPFVLVWEDSNGGWHPPIDPPVDPGTDDEDDDGPDDLNTEDHYAYLIGFTDGTIRPEASITRAEVATVFFRLLTDEAREQHWSQTSGYSDVAAGDWYNNAISTLTNMGILEGKGDGAFHPLDPITKAEFTAIAVRFFDYAAQYQEGTFLDVEADAWYADSVQAAVDRGLIEGNGLGYFEPMRSITRAEAATIVNRTLGRVPHEDHLLPWAEMNVWPDNSNTQAWYYAAMQEATNSHDYTWTTEEQKTVEQWTEKLEERDWAALERAWSDEYSAPGGEVMD